LQVCISRDRIPELLRDGSVQKLHRQRLGSTLSRIARVILGAMLLLAILSANIPSSAVATGPMCTLACCAGRAPHAAGSCMNGSCHAVLSHNQRPHIHRETRIEPVEQLCGLSRVTRNVSRLLFLRTVTTESSPPDTQYSREPSKTASDRTSISTGELTKPCQPDCGAGTVSSTNQRRPRESATHSSADRARPPSNSGLLTPANTFIYAREAIRWQANPRAPPALRS
jgi:hypothetical protein